MHQDNSKTISRSALHFLTGTFVSRLTGAFRDLSLAFCFGASPSIAAFMVAFRFAHLLRRLFGEGPLSSGFIPHFEKLRGSSPKEGALFFRDLSYSLTGLLVVLITVLEIGLFVLLQWGNLTLENQEMLFLTMVMLPGVLFICLYGLNSALLQCEKQFFLPAVAPAAFNFVWIAAVWLVKEFSHPQAALYLSLAITVALFIQWAVTFFSTARLLRPFLSLKECVRGTFFSKDVKVIVSAFFLSVIGVGAVQVNSALDSLFARFASLEGPAHLWYAIRMYQLPLALFGLALSSALLPPLSRAVGAGEWHKYQSLLSFALRKSFSLILPCTIALFVLGAVSVNLLYGRGNFDTQATRQTLLCLWGYGFGLVPSVFVLLLAPAFFAQREYKTPMMASVYSVGLNVILNALMVFVLDWGAFSIAVATSLSAFFNMAYLMRALSKRFLPTETSICDKRTFFSFAKTFVCACIAGATTLALGYFLTEDPTLRLVSGASTLFVRDFMTQVLQFLVLSGVFVLFFFSYAWACNAEDILNLIGLKRPANL